MRRQAGRAVLITGAALLLAGCGSARFGGSGLSQASARPAPPPVDEPIVAAVPSGAVASEPLPPLPGAGQVASADPVAPPVLGGAPSPIQEMRPTTPPQAPSGPTRGSTVGGWTAREATGTTCRVQLSSAPALDLYKASASGCSNRDLARITAWDYREGEVYLYQPGGSVAARLRTSGASMEGVLAKSGAPLTLTR
jgi:hypothetical protein